MAGKQRKARQPRKTAAPKRVTAGKPARKPRPRRGRGLRLLADIGGTSARFALQRAGSAPGRAQSLAVADFPDIEAAIAAFLSGRGRGTPDSLALAVAGPIAGGRAALTNAPWNFDAKALRRRLGLKRVEIVNDFAALACALPRLSRRDLVKIGGGRAANDTPRLVIGPGTGLGIAALVPAAGGNVPVSGEGGHATLAAANERETAVLGVLRRRFGHVSAERAVSGPGLVNLFSAICELEGVPAPRATPEGISRRALEGSSAFCAEALALFCAMLGTVAADAALTFGARGGVYIGGGIVPGLGEGFPADVFRRRFESKGRFSAYLAAIPTFVIVREGAALLGLAALLDAPPGGRR